MGGGAQGPGALAGLGGPPGPIQLRGIGSILHDFYSGVERILERIAADLDGELPAGADGRARLLARMSTEVGSVRPAVIDPRLSAALRPYLRFRHLFRNVYGAELRWDLCRELAEGMPGVWDVLRAQIEAFGVVLVDLHEGCG